MFRILFSSVDCMMRKEGVVNGQSGWGKRKGYLRDCWNQRRCMRD